MQSKQTNPLLTKTEQGIEAKVPPEMKDAYNRIMIAGMEVMFSESTHRMMLDQLKASDDIVKNVAEGIAGLMAILYREAKEKMPIPAAISASIVLMTKALDYAERTMGVEITPDLLAQVSQATAEAVLEKLGISQDMVREAVARSQRGEGPGQGMPQEQAPTAQQPTGLIGA